MSQVYKIVQAGPEQQTILDIPAGNGLLAQRLRTHGHQVICADINDEEGFVYADMSKPLPFEDNTFDTLICMEGLEHLLNPSQMIAECCRITKAGGRIIISLPNVQNMYSRLQFLCTGTFFQFPSILPTQAARSQQVDLGHIAPLSYVQLRYLFSYYGAELSLISGDKFKKKILLPFLLPFILLGYFWSGKKNRMPLVSAHYPDDRRERFNRYLLFSRSIILAFEKE